MPLATPFSKYCPFLLESDVLSLSREFQLSANKLQDVTLGVNHTVVPPGEQILSLLSIGTEVRQIRVVATTMRLTDAQLCELFGLLNLTGALTYRRHLWGHVVVWVLKLRDACLNIYHPPFSWRRQTSFFTLVLGVLRATLAVTLSSLAVTALFAYAGWQVYGTAVMSLALFLVSLSLHEAAHIAIIRRYRCKTSLLQRGLRLGILHARLPAHGEIVSSLAGPVAGVACCLFAGAVAYDIAGAGLLAGLCAVIASFHIGSMLPWYGDGASLRAAFKEKQA